MQAWCRFFSSEKSLANQHILDTLRRAGIEPLLSDACQPGPGLIVFSTVEAQLSRFLDEAKQAGTSQIIAVGLSRAMVSRRGIWMLLEAGARDVLFWDNPGQTAQAVVARFARWKQVDDLMHSPSVRNTTVYQSPAAIAVLQQLVETAYFTDSTVLLMGESGTGKELAARLIHSLDTRPNKGTLVLLDCTTVVPELSGSEFFGHERGAFTSAITARDGAFALADGGTLFLDEVGELPLSLQGQILRAIQEHSYKRVGGNTWHRTEFRLICATNRDLRQEVTQGRFRGDLYFRIAGSMFTLPPLRQRTEDILPLVRHFLTQFKSGGDPPELDDAVKEYLVFREYPGNVRDLKQLVTRMMRRYVGLGPITAGCLPEEERSSAGEVQRTWCDGDLDRCIRRAMTLGVGLKEIGRTVERLAVQIAVADAQGNLQRAAATLRVTDRALQLRRATDGRWHQEHDARSVG